MSTSQHDPFDPENPTKRIPRRKIAAVRPLCQGILIKPQLCANRWRAIESPLPPPPRVSPPLPAACAMAMAAVRCAVIVSQLVKWTAG